MAKTVCFDHAALQVRIVWKASVASSVERAFSFLTYICIRVSAAQHEYAMDFSGRRGIGVSAIACSRICCPLGAA
jgi:hypothetical protein